MKKIPFTRGAALLLLGLSLTFFLACQDDEKPNRNPSNQILTELDADALLFMLEEEKLARDTYTYLNNLWSVTQFANIKDSEQSHMDAIENLLIRYDITYNILPHGDFANQDLQNLYDQFITDGSVNQDQALQIGATIEDLDIVDLQDYIDATFNTDLITVYNRLQCGSRNHLRSFVSVIENNGDSYNPQFLTETEFNTIIQDNHEQCN